MIDYPVMCPVLQRNIDKGTCFDIHMVVAGEAPVDTAPEGLSKVKNYSDICNNCKFHRFD
jgi:hypothetical protein